MAVKEDRTFELQGFMDLLGPYFELLYRRIASSITARLVILQVLCYSIRGADHNYKATIWLSPYRKLGEYICPLPAITICPPWACILSGQREPTRFPLWPGYFCWTP